jgi:hypothetical protein
MLSYTPRKLQICYQTHNTQVVDRILKNLLILYFSLTWAVDNRKWVRHTLFFNLLIFDSVFDFLGFLLFLDIILYLFLFLSTFLCILALFSLFSLLLSLFIAIVAGKSIQHILLFLPLLLCQSLIFLNSSLNFARLILLLVIFSLPSFSLRLEITFHLLTL